MKGIRVGNFRWAIGGFSILIGAMMLVVPHQFSSPIYAALKPQLPLWGTAFLTIGFALLALAALPSSRRIELAVHLLVAMGFLTLAYGFAAAGAWTGSANWVAIGLAAALAPFLPCPSGEVDRHDTPDLLPLALGSGAALTGLAILADLGQFTSPANDVIRPYLPLFGAAFLLGGLALAYVQFLPAAPLAARWTTHFLAGAVLLAFFAASALPFRAWTGIAYYGGMGLLLWLLPWIERRFEGLDPSSLEVRLALALGSGLVLSDILLVALVDAVVARLGQASPSSLVEVQQITFVVLTASALGAAGVGIAAARRLAAPLVALARASERLADEDPTVPLPRSGVGEVAGLTRAFGDMRSRLVAHTAERERLLLEVRRRAAELAAVVENTQAQLALLDRDFTFVMVNSAYERGSGYTRPELIGRNHFALFPSAEAQAIFERVRDTGEPFEVLDSPFEFPDRPNLGTTYWNWVLAPIKDGEGHTRELLLSLLDVTEGVRTRQRVEQAVRVRDEFISIAAHELKTPVTSLLGFAQVMQSELGKTGTVDPARLATAMKRIEQQSSRLARFTEALLDLSRLQSGKLTICREEMDLSSLARGVIASAQEANPKRVIELRGEVPTTVLIDPLRLEQVLTNLIDNAIKFSQSDSVVEIELEASEPCWVEVAVRDRGIGIPEGERERIFERFHQLHPERRFGGMGIGLFISKEIVELHGGSIRVEQPEDGGSRFVVRIPVQGGATFDEVRQNG